MRRSVLLPLLVMAVVGCRPSETAVKADVQAYLARAQIWAGAEAEAARTIERILATQFVDEAEVRRQIADARPRIAAHLETIQAYVPRTSPVQRVHARYVHAWEDLSRSFSDIEHGFDSVDYTYLAKGREGMAHWKEGVVAVARDLRRLADEYDIDTSRPIQS